MEFTLCIEYETITLIGDNLSDLIHVVVALDEHYLLRLWIKKIQMIIALNDEIWTQLVNVWDTLNILLVRQNKFLIVEDVLSVVVV